MGEDISLRWELYKAPITYQECYHAQSHHTGRHQERWPEVDVLFHESCRQLGNCCEVPERKEYVEDELYSHLTIYYGKLVLHSYHGRFGVWYLVTNENDHGSCQSALAQSNKDHGCDKSSQATVPIKD